MEKSLISIIVPVYNCSKYLPRCIESILEQTYTNLQIILIDDGSIDNSGKICDEYAKKDYRIKVIHQANAGVSAARNAGLKIARGEYISFVDSDDYLETDMYSYLYKLIIRYHTFISVCNFYYVSTHNESKASPVVNNETCFSAAEAIEKLLSQLFVWNKLFKASLFQNIKFDEKCSYGEDIPICLAVFEKAKLISYGTEAKYYYRQNEYQVTKSGEWKRGYLGYFNSIDILMDYAHKNQLEKAAKFLTRSKINLTVTFLYRCIKTIPFDTQSAYLLQKNLRKHFFYFLCHIPAKFEKKIFALIVCINLSFTRWLYLSFRKIL